MLSALALAVVVGKIASSAAHEPRGRSELDPRESLAAGESSIVAAPERVGSLVEAAGTGPNHAGGDPPLQSPPCPPREAASHQPPSVSPR